MLKVIFLALLLVGAAPAAFAQTAPTPAPAVKAPQYEHCILVLGDSFFGSRSVQLEFGQNARNSAQNPELMRANAEVRKLASVVAALDYMSGRGWECIDVTTLANAGLRPDTGYLLRRAK